LQGKLKESYCFSPICLKTFNIIEMLKSSDVKIMLHHREKNAANFTEKQNLNGFS